MHSRGLVFLTLLLPGIARRTLRLDDARSAVQQQQNDALADALEESDRAREALIPGSVGHPGHAAQRAGLRRPFGPRHVKGAVDGEGDTEQDQLPPKVPRSAPPTMTEADAAASNLADVGTALATTAGDFGGYTIPIIGLTVLAATIFLLAGPVED